ncbi:MAG: hypothetical protein HY744_06290 [Deltaproteobacteria bacterium]|nr:hypothetical protein [Deltaproteobacteria bacterium]
MAERGEEALVDTDCATRTCEDGICGVAHELADTPCVAGGGQVCDGQGNCVECNDGSQCDAKICDKHLCVPASCADDVMNGDETDVDCGGDDCAPCQNGKKCAVAGDCDSQLCDSGSSGSGGAAGAGGGAGGAGGGGATGLCAPCQSHDVCAPGSYCEIDNTKKCTGKLDDGKGCKAYGAEQCKSGFCVDGYCCNTACDGGCGTCSDDGNEGTCTPVAEGAECRAAAGDCDVAEVCDGKGASCPQDSFNAKDTECRPKNGDCDVAEVCTGDEAGCPADGFKAKGTQCPSGACDGSGSCVAGLHLWSKRFGDGNDEVSRAIVADGSGNAIVTGSFKGTTDFGGGPLASAGLADIFVAKLGP